MEASCLEIDRQLAVSLIPCASKPICGGRACWRFRPVPQETENVALLCLLNPERSGFVSFYLLPRIERDDWQVTFRQDSRFLKEGVQLENLERLYEEALRMSRCDVPHPKVFGSRQKSPLLIDRGDYEFIQVHAMTNLGNCVLFAQDTQSDFPAAARIFFHEGTDFQPQCSQHPAQRPF